MTRGYNFGAGPAMLPEEVLREAQKELLDWQGLGMSVMEVGHRTPEFTALIVEAEHLLRQLLTIPDYYHVLFMGGAARQHFGMIPLNFMKEGQRAGYLITGTWSALAFEEARQLKSAYLIASNAEQGFTGVPPRSNWVFQEDTAYTYFAPNETIQGIRCETLPIIPNVPLMADMTSCLLSEPLAIENYDLIFAGAQKNIANAGLSIVIVREDLLQTIQAIKIPKMCDYRVHAMHKSLYATPPTFNCYLALKMLQWVEKQGGIECLYRLNCQKAQRLYHYIDSSSFYHCKIEEASRSLMNVCFFINDRTLEETFIAQAAQKGLLALKGHKTSGGLRASLYNAMPMEGVEHLMAFMDEFALHYG